MNCLDIQDKIVDLILCGELDPLEKRMIMEHIEHCPFCAEDYKFLSQCIGACECPELQCQGDIYWEEFVVSVHEKIALEKPRPLFPYRIVIPIAASVFAIIGISYFLFFKPAQKQIAKPSAPGAQNDPFQEVYELTPEEQQEFIKMINQRYYGE
jgi:hypothetical protein